MEDNFRIVSEAEALGTAKIYGLEEEIKECISEGMTPEEALIEWDIDLS